MDNPSQDLSCQDLRKELDRILARIKATEVERRALLRELQTLLVGTAPQQPVC